MPPLERSLSGRKLPRTHRQKAPGTHPHCGGGPTRTTGIPALKLSEAPGLLIMWHTRQLQTRSRIPLAGRHVQGML